MQIEPQKVSQPFIVNKQIVLSLLEFTPISAFLALVAIVITFAVPPSSPLPFLLLLTPLYINLHSYCLGVCVIGVAFLWPVLQLEDEIMIRLTLIVNAVYLISSRDRPEKYRMVPSQIINEGVPILL